MFKIYSAGISVGLDLVFRMSDFALSLEVIWVVALAFAS